MDFETFEIERKSDGTAVLWMRREQKLNAMNHMFFEELPRAMQALDQDDGIAACVLTGAGRAFSAGGDISDFNELAGPQEYRRQVRLALGAFHAIEQAETVVIAAVNGLAYGGGTELTLACDMAFAATDARFAFREITVGLMPAFGVVRAPESIGRSWTSWLALSGAEIEAGQAHRLGFVQQVCEPERLLDEALTLAQTIASRPRLAVRAAKQFINRHSSAGLQEAIEATALLYADPECKELIEAFVSARQGGA
ncbi:MAG TPA: enoyl-CoA hydratase/isomerase family protein [Solirubrobacteraceae bacterium]|jgi:enoyl-CoA hydratase/carnithine racemase